MLTATYSPEDNKLRLYSLSRLSAELYDRVKAAGFKWAPKQELFVAPMWTPAREDLLLELCEEIGDEDYSALERSADRAERFGQYRDKRASEAGQSADTFDAGPSVFGHQSAARAERQAARHDRHRGRACSQWSKAEYWQSRTQAVIGHALYKSSAKVRRGRILELEAAQRKNNKEREEYAQRYSHWQRVLTLEGADTCALKEESSTFIGISKDTAPAPRLAYALANSGFGGYDYTHPRTGEKGSLYQLLTDKADPITAREAAQLWLDGKPAPGDPDSSLERWAQHYELRLTYERAMLAEEGGSAADAEIVPGGFVAGFQIVKVNKSPATGRVVSVRYLVDGKEKLRNVERLPEGAYRAPTAEELAAFHKAQQEQKAAAKATKPKEPSLINPTDEDAQKLQDLWNAQAAAAHQKHGRYGECPAVQVRRMTQAEYSARSKGSYGSCEASDVSENLRVRRCNDRERQTVFKVRTASPGVSSFSACRAVVVLTDKPQKPLPWEDVETAKADAPSEETLFPRLGELLAIFRGSDYYRLSDEQAELLGQAVYVGWAYSASSSQRGFTEAGVEACKRWKAQQAEAVSV